MKKQLLLSCPTARPDEPFGRVSFRRAYFLFLRRILWIIPYFVLSGLAGFCQNVGIGTSTPTKGKLEVFGAAGSTSAIFGSDGTGISLQRNWPTIGFNQYRDAVSGKYISNGFAATQFFNTGFGYMAFDMFPEGLANATTAPSIRAMTIFATGNMFVKDLTVSSGGNLAIESGNLKIESGELQTNATGAFNLMPLAYGSVGSTGGLNSGTPNVSVSYNSTINAYIVELGQSSSGTIPIATANASGVIISSFYSSPTSVAFSMVNRNGVGVTANFFFVIYKQ